MTLENRFYLISCRIRKLAFLLGNYRDTRNRCDFFNKTFPSLSASLVLGNCYKGDLGVATHFVFNVVSYIPAHLRAKFGQLVGERLIVDKAVDPGSPALAWRKATVSDSVVCETELRRSTQN